MRLILGTSDGVWHVRSGTAGRLGLVGKTAVHVADRNGTILAAAPRDGLNEVSEAGERRLWEGDACARAVAPDGRLYVGVEPAMLFRSDDRGETWRRQNQIDALPTRHEWYFRPRRVAVATRAACDRA